MHKLVNRLYALGVVFSVALYALLVCLVLAAPAVYIGVKAAQHTHGKRYT